MNWYGVQRTYGYEKVTEKLYVFDTRAKRDSFLKSGERYSYALSVPWETFPVKASDAKKYASTDDNGDMYACLYWGGVKYVWGRSAA